MAVADQPSGLMDIASSLTQDEIPFKLRCAMCNKLAVNAFRLPCCDQAICEHCQASLPETCPVCAHTPISPDLCKPNKALRTTLKAFLRTEEKKREKERQSATPATPATTNGATTADGTPAQLETPAVPSAAEVPASEEIPALSGTVDAPPAETANPADTGDVNAQNTPGVSDEAPTETQVQDDQSASVPADTQNDAGDAEHDGSGEGNEADEAKTDQVNDDEASQGAGAGTMLPNGMGFGMGAGMFPNMAWNNNGGFNPMAQFMNNGMFNFPNAMGMPGMAMDPMAANQGMFGGYGMNMNGMNMGMSFDAGQGMYGGWDGSQNNMWNGGQDKFNPNAFANDFPNHNPPSDAQDGVSGDMSGELSTEANKEGADETTPSGDNGESDPINRDSTQELPGQEDNQLRGIPTIDSLDQVHAAQGMSGGPMGMSGPMGPGFGRGGYMRGPFHGARPGGFNGPPFMTGPNMYPEPRGQGVEGAPAAPRAMREGLPNTSILRQRNFPGRSSATPMRPEASQSVTPTPGQEDPRPQSVPRSKSRARSASRSRSPPSRSDSRRRYRERSPSVNRGAEESEHRRDRPRRPRREDKYEEPSTAGDGLQSGIDVAVAGRIVRIATVAGAAARVATATLLDPIISIPRPKKKILETSPAMREYSSRQSRRARRDRDEDKPSAASAAEPEKDPHTLEREARNRERMLKEQQRREAMHADRDAGKSSRKRDSRAMAGGRRFSYKYEDEENDDDRAARVEKEREAGRWK
ncbi:amidohydrolase family protein [Aspergillus niger]|uniref:Amidohydrolase family protein n=1 Tax=Aspergillus niger TaxID=5061 RepID=A0A505IC14_ASPNG|nr:amidohydrolase family protein [Aspergillus niger]